MADEPWTLQYRDGRVEAPHRRLVRQVVLIIVIKLSLVATNVVLAVIAAPPGLRLAGLAAQLALTVVFLAVLFRLVSLRRPGE